MATIPIVNTIDKRNGIIAAVVAMIGIIAYLLIASIEMADPPPKNMPVESIVAMPEEIDLKEFVVEGGGASGEAAQDDVVKPQPQTEKVLTSENSETTTPSGESTHTNANNQTNTSSTSQQSDNPFASGGSDDEGTGPGESVFGNSPGPGNGPGSSAKKRSLIKQPNFANFPSNENATIVLIVTIDAQGNVVSASCSQMATTTTNQNLINQVIAKVRKEAKYNKDPNASLVKVKLIANVKAH